MICETAHAEVEKHVLFNSVVHRNTYYNFTKQPLAKGSSTTVTRTNAMENKAISEIIISLAEIRKEKFDHIEVMEHYGANECRPIFNINDSLRKGQFQIKKYISCRISTI